MLALFSLLFAPELNALSSPEYAARESAQGRLERVGWLAAPALWQGMQSDSAEVSERCSVVWAGLLARRSLPAACCRLIDATGRFDRDRDSWRWCQLTPYLTGSLDGDFRYAAAAAGQGVPPPPPVVPQMPTK